MTSVPFCDGIQVAWNCWLQVLKSRGKMSRSGKKLSKKSEGGRSSPVVVRVPTYMGAFLSSINSRNSTFSCFVIERWKSDPSWKRSQNVIMSSCVIFRYVSVSVYESILSQFCGWDLMLPSSINWEECSNYLMSRLGKEWMEISSSELREAFTFVSWSSSWEVSSPFFSAKVMHDVQKKSRA